MRLHPDFDFTSLSDPDRIRLALALWDSLNPSAVDEHFPLTPAQAHDLDRRVAEMDRDGDAGVPWEEVVARVRGRAGSSRRRG